MTIKITPAIIRALETLAAADRKLGDCPIPSSRNELERTAESAALQKLIDARDRADNKLLKLLHKSAGKI